MDSALQRRVVKFFSYFRRYFPFHTLTQTGKNAAWFSIANNTLEGYRQLGDELASKRKWSIKKEYYTTNTPTGIWLHFQDNQHVKIDRRMNNKRANPTVGHEVGRLFFPLRKDAITFVLNNRKEL